MGLAFELRKIEADGGEDVAAKFKEAKPTERVIDQIGEFLSGVGVRKTDWDCISVGTSCSSSIAVNKARSSDPHDA